MNAQAQIQQLAKLYTVPHDAVAEAREIIASLPAGVETSKKIAELFNQFHPSPVNSLANRWIYQAIVYTNDATYEALDDNIHHIAERYFALRALSDLVEAVKEQFSEANGFQLDIQESTNLIEAKGPENAIKFGYALANVTALTDLFFNENGAIYESIGKDANQVDAELQELTKQLVENGDFIVAPCFLRIRPTDAVENGYVLAISERFVELFRMHNSDF